MNVQKTTQPGMVLDISKSMRVLILLVALFLNVGNSCYATDNNGDLLSIIKLTPGTATEAHITAMLGKPSVVEESKKKTWWHYTHGTSNLVICWNKKDAKVEKFSFTSTSVQKPVFDNKKCRFLKSGATNLAQAMTLLGTPKDMTIKKMTQEMHYTYEKNVLRLFFRDKVLVDFTLLSQR